MVQHLFPSSLAKEIRNAGIEIAQTLEKLCPHIADLGIDIGIDKNNHLWIIEVNFFDEKAAYRESNQYKMWFDSYRFPFEFALSEYRRLQKNTQN
ncbi:YheC/YheD family protein [Tepidibacillus marianensis]|uniref:YheC/YheD family protein n=1 Tax=Tepidibacillus marianensis TaxID=3131995 RepID=UPI0030CF4A63